jgi:hypothetical protein
MASCSNCPDADADPAFAPDLPWLHAKSPQYTLTFVPGFGTPMACLKEKADDYAHSADL